MIATITDYIKQDSDNYSGLNDQNQEKEIMKPPAEEKPKISICLNDFVPRLYQETIFSSCISHNCMVVIPTGMGKTSIAMMLAVHRLKQYPNSKILFLAPTKPLAQQHMHTFRKHIAGDDIMEDSFVLFTGSVAPEKRSKLWRSATFIFSTPQGLENDIINNSIALEEISLIVIDEAQHATGNYAYNFIAKQYDKRSQFPKILALTASPGTDMDKIKEVCGNLHIDNIEIRTDNDPDVKPYIKEIDIRWVKLDFPKEFEIVKNFLDKAFNEKIAELRHNAGSLNVNMRYISKKELLGMQAKLHMELSKGSKDYSVMKSISVLAEIMKISHASELLETQGISVCHSYLSNLEEESANTKVKAVKNLAANPYFIAALAESKKVYEKGIEHPKIGALKLLVKKELEENPEAKVIVFNQYREMVDKIVKELSYELIKAKGFIGQAKKNGASLNQKQQKQMLEEFSRGEFSVLVSTSVGEEGIDIPKVDAVIFYEPVPSAIRQIQRRGRTARNSDGKVFVLVTKKTRDEAYSFAAQHKERKMYSALKEIKHEIKLNPGFTFAKEKTQDIMQERIMPKCDFRPKIIIDDREKSSMVVKELIELDADTKMERIDTADYVMSERVAAEYKTVHDFVDSVLDGRLLQQLKQIKQAYERPLVIVEGQEDIYSVRNVHPNAIRGMLATIAVSYGIPIIFTKNSKETAALLHIIAKREQEEGNRCYSMHCSKPLTEKEMQEYIVSALPNIGLNTARELLQSFGSVLNVFNASEEELKQTKLIGEKKAEMIRRVVDGRYKG